MQQNLLIPTGNVFLDKPTCSVSKKFGIRTPNQLRDRCTELSRGGFLVDGLLREQSLSIVVGDSGLGKTPLLYQLGLSVALGVPFLDHSTTQGKVLYLDFENSLNDVLQISSRQAGFLGHDISNAENLYCWNVNDSDAEMGVKTFREVALDISPKLIIIDPITALVPKIEEQNNAATSTYQELRKVMKDSGCAVVMVHHLRKSGNGPDSFHIPLDREGRKFFSQARGSRALINGCDVRLGVEKPTELTASNNEDLAIVFGGFGRVTGDLPLLHLQRSIDDNGDPIGYRRAKGEDLLFNPLHKEAFRRLPNEFKFSEAKRIYGKSSQPTTDFLKKCKAAGLINDDAAKGYVKVT
ncbi:MAG: AAA family ATPase [Bryobacteraceae bacterium]